MDLTNTTDNRLDIKFNLSNPDGCIDAANKNVKRVMPKLNVDGISKKSTGVLSVGVVDTGNITLNIIDVLNPNKKTKNTGNSKRKD